MARSALLNIMVTAAFKAGRSLTKDFGEIENLQVSVKGPADFVSKADLRAEQIERRQRVEYLLLACPAMTKVIAQQRRRVFDDRPVRRIHAGGVERQHGDLHGRQVFIEAAVFIGEVVGVDDALWLHNFVIDHLAP